MMADRDRYDVVIAGGGPAGSSAAIRLASTGLKVLLIEKATFPRQKLCGEFVSPECLVQFADLGVLPTVRSAGAVTIDRTVFYSKRGNRTIIQNNWSGIADSAIGISRAELDLQLLTRARTVGAEVLEGSNVTGSLRAEGRVTGVTVRSGSREDYSVAARCVIDATGRRSLLRDERSMPSKAKFVAFKTHLDEVSIEKGSCEIYSYPGGYGGCNEVEAGRFNVCFIVRASDVRRLGNDLDQVMRNTLCANPRAAQALESSVRKEAWLSVPLERFGRGECVPSPGMLAVGDAASFIDPFTGSGILLGLQSSEIACSVLVDLLSQGREHDIGAEYQRRYAEAFGRRLRISSMLRYAAFVPNAAELMIQALRISPALGRWLARSTRSSGEHSV